MWAHYADKHSGVCLCFDFPDDKTIILPRSNWNARQRAANASVRPQRVTYVKSRPKINYASGTYLVNFFLTKYEAWCYEKEYRAFVMEDYGEFKYKPEYLTGIIVGCKMPAKNLGMLHKVVKDLPAPVKLFLTIPAHNAFRLDIKKIH